MSSRQQIKELYEQEIQPKLRGMEGKFVAIDAESGDYFIGSNPLEAYKKGKLKYPYKKFFYKRIGSKAAFTVGVTRP
ncbi:MAG: hypothetical protein AABX13_03325 [Nanoarchaeota archaeon]